jgi:5'-3' exonuclease
MKEPACAPALFPLEDHMAQKILLIDGNAIGYAAQQATKLNTGSMETQAAFGIIKTVRELRVEHRAFVPMMLWDGRAEWRFKLHPDYKSNRKDTPEKRAMKEAYAKQKPYVERLLCHLGVRQMTAFNMEADDLAGYFTAKLAADPANEIGLITGDGDWMQLVRRNVWWQDPRSAAKLVTAANFYNKTGCRSPFSYLETKVLVGDSSDCVPGVGGIGEKGAPEFIAEFGSVRDFWQRVDTGTFTPRLKKHQNLASPAGRAVYKRNFQLMQLLRVPAPPKDQVKVDIGKFDKEAFASVCEELAFASILRNLDEFTKPFTN